MSTKLSPYQFFGTDASGDPLSGYQVFTYAAGSTTKQTTYQDSGGVTPHANPIELNTLGFPPAPIWLTEGETYKLVVAEPDDTDPPTGSVRIFDNISGVNDTASSIDQWITGPAPTYVSATQFTLAGDQTGIFHVGRRLKTTNSGGTIYSTITASAYTSVTTITVANDSGTLDAGLSAVFYGILSVTNTSAPAAGTLGSPQTTTSGSTKDFSIPPWAKKITIIFSGVSVSGTSLAVRIGDSGGVSATGYASQACHIGTGTSINTVTSATGLFFVLTAASSTVHGVMTLALENSSSFIYVASGAFNDSGVSSGNIIVSGSKTLSSILTTVQIFTGGTFDAGEVNVFYQ
jgi:hypothetical protein